MITEDFVSVETAKLLKEKGFDEAVRCFYDIQTEILCDNCVKTKNSYTESIAAPTLQMAMKWLREKYYIHADPIKQGNYNDCSEYYTWIVARMGIIHRNSTVADKLSYEKACEAAIKYCLENLI